jgi:hypothetical protein
MEIRSPHFSVVTDAGEKRGREVAMRFEQMRTVLRRMTKANLNLSALKGEDSQATLRITTLTLAPEGSHRPHASGF